MRSPILGSLPQSPEETYENLHLDEDEFLRRAAIRDPVVFAEKNLRNESGGAIEFREEHGFQIQYLRDFSPKLCVVKSSQVGITVASITKCLFLAHINDSRVWKELFGRETDSKGISIIYTMPTANDVNDFSAARFKTMINSSEELVELIGGKKGIDAVERKKFGDSFIYFRGTQKERQAISIPADLIVNDEIDFSDPSIIEVLNSRLSFSKLKWWWKFSTPTIPNYGVDAEFRQSNQYHFFIRCQHCGRRQQVRFPRNIKVKKIRGNRIKFWGCVKCGKELDRTKGVWEAKYPNREYHGYRIPPTICPWIQPQDLLDQKKSYRTEKRFRNYGLGEAFSTGQDVISRELLLNRVETGRIFNPVLDRDVYMGVDQGDTQHYVIARREGNRREVLKVGTVTAFEEIAQLMKNWNVNKCVMDALPNKVPATKMANDHYGSLLLAFYKEFDEQEDVKESKSNKWGILLDRTNTLDMTAESWRNGESVIVMDHPGMINALDDPSTNDLFIQQMGNMTRDEQENLRTGKKRAVWVSTGPDHYRHADSYCHMAFLQGQGGNIDDLMIKENNVVSSGLGEIPDIGGIRSGYRTIF